MPSRFRTAPALFAVFTLLPSTLVAVLLAGGTPRLVPRVTPAPVMGVQIASQPAPPQPAGAGLAPGPEEPRGAGDQTQSPGPAEATRPIDPKRAMEMLRDGNRRFRRGEPIHPHETAGWRRRLESGQHPFAVVIGCSDSRVPPELVFDQGLGDLFVIRVAGNVVETDVVASVEYAIDHLDTRLVVVMGHTRCGAVTATMDHLTDPAGEPAEVVSLLYRIEPAMSGIDPGLPRHQRLSQAVINNVTLAVRRLSRVPDLRRSVGAGRLRIVGAVYDMHTGAVRFIEGGSPNAAGLYRGGPAH